MHETRETETETSPQTVTRPATVAEETTVVRGRSWSLASMAAIAVGGLLLVVGIVAMIRADAGDTWRAKIVQVAGLDHNALLGLIEAATGAVLIIAGAARARGMIIFVSAAMVVAGIIVVMEHESLRDDVAVNDAHGWWAIGLGAGLLLLAAFVRPRSRTTVTQTVVDDTMPVERSDVHVVNEPDVDPITDPRWH